MIQVNQQFPIAQLLKTQQNQLKTLGLVSEIRKYEYGKQHIVVSKVSKNHTTSSIPSDTYQWVNIHKFQRIQT